MPLFNITAVRVTPITNTVQPQPPLEEFVVEPVTILAQNLEQAKLELGRRIPKDENIGLIKSVVLAINYTG